MKRTIEGKLFMKLTPIKRDRFCSILALGSSVTEAARAIDVSTVAMYKAKKLDEQFAADWDAAIEEGTDVLEDEAVRRAKDKSDTLLIFLLKGRRPKKYGDSHTLKHTDPSGERPPVFIVDIGKANE